MELEYVNIQTQSGCMYGGNQSLFGEKVRKSGCGMIAACDMLLYLNGRSHTPVRFAEYSRFVEKFRDETAYKGHSNLLGIPQRRLVKILNANTENYIFSFKSRFFLNRKKLTEIISASLESGLPVIVRIGANIKKLPYKIMYPASGKKLSCGKMRWHYITVTGLSENGELTFSSWGGKGTLLLNDLCRHFGFTGGIILGKQK